MTYPALWRVRPPLQFPLNPIWFGGNRRMWRICVAWAPRRRMLISNDKPGNEDVGLMERIPFRILRSFESSVCERRVQLRHVSRKLSCGNFPGAGKLSDLPPGAPCGSSSAGIRRPRAAEKPKGTLDMDHDEVR